MIGLPKDKARSAQIAELAGGYGVLMNCNFGLCVRLDEEPDGRVAVSVDAEPISGGYDGQALRSFMESTAVAWLRKVAPHRLALGADDR